MLCRALYGGSANNSMQLKHGEEEICAKDLKTEGWYFQIRLHVRGGRLARQEHISRLREWAPVACVCDVG